MPYTTTIPGLPGGPLMTRSPVFIKLIPPWRTRNRPGIIARTPRRSVQHGNGNPNSTARGEINYIYNGAGGRQASYHAASDDRETGIGVPANEVTWQAADGGGPGNYNGLSCEMIEDADVWNDPHRRMECIRNNADVMGGMSARLGIVRPEQHWDFNYRQSPANRHDCPNKLRNIWIDGRKAWDIYRDLWYEAKAAELSRMNGDIEVIEPDQPVGDTVTGDAVVNAEIGLNLRNGPGTIYRVLSLVPYQEEIELRGDPVNGWYPVAWGDNEGWVSGDWLTAIEFSTDGPPVYAPPIPIESLKGITLERWNTAPAVITEEGMRFVCVADLVEAVRDTPRNQSGYDGSPVVGKPIKQGERFAVLWLFTARHDGQLWYLTPPVYDENGALLWGWTRIKVADTKRIADAPIIPGEEPVDDLTNTLQDVLDSNTTIDNS